MAINFSDESITITSIAELMRLSQIVGGLQNLSLEHPVADEKKNVLIAAKRPLRENLLTALENRKDIANWLFVIEKSSTLRLALEQKISLEIEKKLTLADFSFAAWLLHRTKIDIFQILRSALNNDFFLITLLKIQYEELPIWPHLLEMALLAVGLFADCEKNPKFHDAVTAFMAAILHDYSIIEERNWEMRDIFPSEGHDIESAALLKTKKIPEYIPQIIRDTNKLTERFRDYNENQVKWLPNSIELLQAIILVCEYYLYCKRNFSQAIGLNSENSDFSDVLFQLGLETQRGAFPNLISQKFQHHYERFSNFFEYGQKIAKLEQSCKFQKYALAYPKPRATQVLCRDFHVVCPLRLATQQVTVLQAANQVINRFGENLPPGNYDKCRLSEDLPEPPTN